MFPVNLVRKGNIKQSDEAEFKWKFMLEVDT